ncbi:hypothetical protein [Allochromatium palmeri]|uniref:Uncharacterized protein n=1 Tax=Allochromatium palmeri TaxID=231048 RepID=A0A6N8EJW2_9GAMM|nr:hypothetical protein [Allochromatium palmeri]MTW22807.1 hypothetical protein [Allochromatium palmeri]
MSDTTTTTEAKRRGRPKGPRPALTSAERMRHARERVRFALDDPEGDITTLPDQLLLEAVALAYRKDRPEALFFGVEELFGRLNARSSDEHAYVVHLERIPKGDTVTNKATDDNVTVMDNEPMKSDTVTPPRSDADLVCLLLDRFGTYTGIARALAGTGHKIDRSNLSRIHRDGQTASPETRAALLALVDQEA